MLSQATRGDTCLKMDFELKRIERVLWSINGSYDYDLVLHRTQPQRAGHPPLPFLGHR